LYHKVFIKKKGEKKSSKIENMFQIINLMDIDILQEQHLWKQSLKSIRDIVRQVEEKVKY
jgi:hypothetical protein